MVQSGSKGKIGPIPTPLIIVVALSLLAVGVITFLGEEPPDRRKPTGIELPSKEEAIGRNFRISVRGEVIHYNETYTWSENNYQTIIDNEGGFRSIQVQHFEETYGMEPKFYETRFIDTDMTTLFECEIREKVTENENRYTAEFDWFLNPRGLNFVENDFEGTKTELTWHGEFNGISTGIVIDLPQQEIEYSEGGELVGYNHSTIWWPENARG